MANKVKVAESPKRAEKAERAPKAVGAETAEWSQAIDTMDAVLFFQLQHVLKVKVVSQVSGASDQGVWGFYSCVFSCGSNGTIGDRVWPWWPGMLLFLFAGWRYCKFSGFGVLRGFRDLPSGHWRHLWTDLFIPRRLGILLFLSRLLYSYYFSHCCVIMYLTPGLCYWCSMSFVAHPFRFLPCINSWMAYNLCTVENSNLGTVFIETLYRLPDIPLWRWQRRPGFFGLWHTR